MRIKQLHTFVGFTILGLFVQSGLSDISLTLRNGLHGSGPGYGRSRKTYLPPPVKPVQHNTEKYYRIQAEHAPTANQHQHQPQQQFQESNYGNARYQIFEVHNHYAPTSKHHGAAPQAVVHIKHINSGIAPGPHPAINDNHLDISYLSFAANDGPNGEQITIHEQLPPPPPPAPPVPQVTPNVPVAFPSNYQHNFQKTSSNAGVVSPTVFKTNDYLPPNREATAIVANSLTQQRSREPFKGPDYLPPHKQGPSDSLDASASARGAPDYLPPHQGAPPPVQQYLAPQLPQQQHIAINTHQTNHHNEFKGPDYLPPHHSGPVQAPANQLSYQVSSSAGAYRGPDYLPPHGGSQVQQPQPQRFQQQQAPNLNIQHNQQMQQSAAISSVFRGPDYLPPHQEHTPIQQHLLQQPFKGPDYLPPHGKIEATSSLGHHQHVETQSLQPNAPQRAPGFLPAGYDFNNPEEKQFQQQQQHQQHIDQQVQIQQSPYQYQENVPVAAQLSHPVPTPGTLGTPGTLPPGYEFNKPENAEQAIAELHGQAPPSQPQPQQPNYQTQQQQPLQQQPLQQQPLPQQPLQQQPLQQQPLQQQHFQQQPLPQQDFVPSSAQQQQHLQVALQSQIQVANNNAPVPDIVHGEQKIATPPEALSTYQADPAGYLPPHAESQPHQQQASPVAVNYAAPVSVPQYEQPQIAPQQHLQQYHSAPQQQQQFNQQQHMHSLSSYMTTVQPYERYGDAQFTTSPRKPFDKYGPPPVTTPLPLLQQQQQSFVDVAPMYREPTARPHAYAPAMSYTENPVPASYTTYTLNEQTKQQLQQFMPREIQQQHQQQHIEAAPTAGKIRTVQIVNPNTIKTLKVLETSDAAGVRTIKILGPSNESPMGEHRIVNVVSQSGADGKENHVQTVKIYNDHQDVAIGATGTAAAIGASGNNAYLPPATTAVNKKRLVRDSHHLQAQPRRRIGKEINNRRYRQRF